MLPNSRRRRSDASRGTNGTASPPGTNGPGGSPCAAHRPCVRGGDCLEALSPYVSRPPTRMRARITIASATATGQDSLGDGSQSVGAPARTTDGRCEAISCMFVRPFARARLLEITENQAIARRKRCTRAPLLEPPIIELSNSKLPKRCQRRASATSRVHRRKMN
jgi:hypothetical protein